MKALVKGEKFEYTLENIKNISYLNGCIILVREAEDGIHTTSYAEDCGCTITIC